MSSTKPRILLRLEYEEAADQYLRSLPMEHFMESASQGTQRKITLESLDLVHAQRPEIQVFNELLIQYPHPRTGRILRVVPDNLVVVHSEPIKARGSFDVPFQPVSPFWVLEYVSQHNQRKDYDQSFKKYERELKVPYLLVFYPEDQELTLYRHSRKKYAAVRANAQGRFAIPELEMEAAILDEWVRFWFRGKLLPLPADMLRELRETRRQLAEATRRAEEERQARLAVEQELAQLRAKIDGNGERRKKP